MDAADFVSLSASETADPSVQPRFARHNKVRIKDPPLRRRFAPPNQCIDPTKMLNTIRYSEFSQVIRRFVI
ncbi:MAG: hypothetical protein QME32_07510 [Endomicrobiia bacterium]|nr:hypothetical protein [Endomicrobiia bacterium]